MKIIQFFGSTMALVLLSTNLFAREIQSDRLAAGLRDLSDDFSSRLCMLRYETKTDSPTWAFNVVITADPNYSVEVVRGIESNKEKVEFVVVPRVVALLANAGYRLVDPPCPGVGVPNGVGSVPMYLSKVM